MSKIRYYLEGNRQDRINHAVSHTKEMEERFPNEIAKNVLKKGLDISLISGVTGLSNEQINNLK